MTDAEVTEEECEELAGLARLSLSRDETRHFADQLGHIVGYLQQLAAVDVEGVPEYAPPAPASAPLRADETGDPLPRQTVLAQAPSVSGEHVRVPKFMED